jgi:hypothetical protein
MKVFLLLLWPSVALLMLAAHFYRAGLWPMAIAVVLVNSVLLVRRAWTARAVQAVLLLGAFEWLRALAAFVGERVAAGQPYVRLVVILGVVALFTAGAALVFRSLRLRARYGIGGRS